MRRLGVATTMAALLMLPTEGAQPAGPVRVTGRALADDGGPFTVLGASLFWAAWGYRYDRPRLEANLAFLAAHGVDAIRVLGVVGPGAGWQDRTVAPSWSDYDEVVAGLTDLAFDQYGLRVQWTIFGGVDGVALPEQRRELVERFRRVLEPRASKVLFIEIANEGYQTGFGGAAGLEELRSLGRDLAARSPLLVALTAPQNPIEDSRGRPVDPQPSAMSTRGLYADSGVDVVTRHYDRGLDGPGGPWQPARRPWDAESWLLPLAAALPTVRASNEPIGPGSSNASERDPARLVASALVAWISGHAVHVYHSGAGVRGGGEVDLDRGRPANVYDVPGAVAQLDALSRAQDLMPGDVPNWARIGPADPAHPLGAAAADAYCARRDADFVCAVITITGDAADRRASWRMEVAVHDPVLGGAPRVLTLAAGERLTLAPARSVVVLVGRAYN